MPARLALFSLLFSLSSVLHAEPALPAGAVVRVGTPWMRHRGSVYQVAFAPDGKSLFAADNDRRVVRWDVASGKELNTYLGHTSYVRSVAVSPDGKYVVAGGETSALLWDVATGKEIARLTGHTSNVFGVAFSPDGKMVATASLDGLAKLWDVPAGKLARDLKGHGGPVMTPAFSPDGKIVATASHDGTVRLWDVATGKEQQKLAGHDNAAAVAFAPDGKTVATGDGDGVVRLWGPTEGKLLATHRGPAKKWILSIAFTRDGKRIAWSGQDAQIWLADAALKQPRVLATDTDSVIGIALSPDGSRIAAGGDAQRVRLWDVESGQAIQPPGGHPTGVSGVALAADGKTLFTADREGGTCAWEVPAGKERWRVQSSGTGMGLAITPDNKALALGGTGAVHVLEAQTGKELATLPAGTPKVDLAAVSFTADGKTLLCLGESAAVLYELATRRELRRVSDPGGFTAVAMTPDGERLVTAGRDNALRVWDRTGQEVHRLAGEATCRAVAFSADGRRVAWGDRSGQQGMWEPATGQRTYLLKLPKPIGPTLFLPDGRALVVGSENAERGVSLWETATGGERRAFQGHIGPVSALSTTSDGRRLASGGEDGTAVVWEPLPPGESVSEMERSNLWNSLASQEASPAYAAIGRLTAAPEWVLARARMEVRPVSLVKEADVVRLIAALDDDEFMTREKAQEELERLGEAVEQPLRAAAEKTTSAELKRRALVVLEKLSVGIKGAPERLRALRVLELLERIGTADVRKFLRELAAGAPGAWLTEDARASLTRLERLATVPR